MSTPPRRLADQSQGLKPDATDLRSQEEALAVYRKMAVAFKDECDWRDPIRTKWPGPIAHEVEILVQLVDGGASGEAQLFQIRDIIELLVKLPTAVLARAVVEGDPSAADDVRKLIYRRAAHLSHWIAAAKELAGRTKARSDAIGRLARAVEKQICPAAEQFVVFRNDMIGHAARMVDALELARVIEDYAFKGRYQPLDRSRPRNITSLTALLSGLVEAQAFEGLRFFVESGEQQASLVGYRPLPAASGSREAPDHDHEEPPVPLQVDTGSCLLNLAPLAAVRRCPRCGAQDLFLFDTIYDARRGGRYDLIDYARGHKARLSGLAAPDIHELAREFDAGVSLADGSFSEQRVFELLDKARIDRAYRRPDYLREPLRRFLQTEASGVYWLQAPAHVGKTTFVAGLVNDTLDNEPIDDRKPFIVHYYCRKEYRTGIPQFIGTLENQLLSRTSDAFSVERPSSLDVKGSLTPKDFLDWLVRWWRFLIFHGKFPETAPMILVLDGLDEADPPEQGSLLHLLPRPEDLPDNVYLILTSRPVAGEDELAGNADEGSPEFLRTFVAPLYTKSA